MKIETFKQLSIFLWGKHWQHDAARTLGVHVSTVQRTLKGTIPMTTERADIIAKLALKRVEELKELMDEVSN